MLNILMCPLFRKLDKMPCPPEEKIPHTAQLRCNTAALMRLIKSLHVSTPRKGFWQWIVSWSQDFQNFLVSPLWVWQYSDCHWSTHSREVHIVTRGGGLLRALVLPVQSRPVEFMPLAVQTSLLSTF